jgi:hypothetical protein
MKPVAVQVPRLLCFLLPPVHLLTPTSPFALPPSPGIFTVSLVMWRVLKEFLLFARQEKKWWLVPLVVLLVLLGAILIFASSSGIAWALYPFF